MAGVLGQGGSGIVYDATWGPRRVALKVLHPSLVGTGKERSQFLAEAERLQQITHPSVVKIFASGQLPDGRPYLAMERLEGETLAAVIARGALPLSRALELFAELCAAVAALHESGLVHRDLKPENVFVVDGKHAVLLDFGIAKGLDAPASTTTQEGSVRGTPAYMAPERFFGQQAGIATDIYELAVVLYMMLAGRLPWDEVADPEMRLSPRPLVELAHVPDALDIEVRRALSTRAQNRPSSATALQDAIRAAAEGATSEPTAGETARLRSGAQSEVTAQQRTPSADHPTPLAWAPTERPAAAPLASARVSRRHSALVLVLAIVGVGIAGGAFAWWRLRGRVAPGVSPAVTRATTGAQDDPWAPRPPPLPAKTQFALVAEPLAADAYRAELVAAIEQLPSNTRFIGSVQLTDLRANAQTAQLLESFANNPKLSALDFVVPTCVRSLARDSEWMLYGTPSIRSSGGTLIVRGRWLSSDVTACLSTTHVKPATYRFLGEHTIRITLGDEPIGGVNGPDARMRALLQRLPPSRSLAVVADGAAKDDWSSLGLPTGSDVFGSILVDANSATLELAADPHAAAAAQTLVDKIQPELDSVFKNANTDATGKVEARREGTVVHISGRLTSLMLGIVTSALQP